jgi:hypothetical protein
MHTRLTPIVDRVRQPAYTGENRCLPCTAANLAIAGGLAVALGLVSTVLGGLVFAAGIAAIWLRGYLVPGTPELTARYAPDWLLAAVDKAPAAPGGETATPAFDAEAYLLEAGLVEYDARIDDVALAPGFARRWYDRMATTDVERGGGAMLADLIGIPAGELDVEYGADGGLVAFVDTQYVGQWESRAAFTADVTAAAELDGQDPAWRDLALPLRSQLLAALRLFLDRCPLCDGPVAIGDDVVRSCCRSREVVVVECRACDARLLELPVAPESLAADGAAGSDARSAPAARP